MAVIHNFQFETGDLTESAGPHAIDAGNLSAQTAAVLNGTYGLSAVINDLNVLQFRYDLTKSTTYRFRFYFDPNTVTISDTNSIGIYKMIQGGGSFSTIIYINLNLTSSQYYFALKGYNDAGTDVVNDTCAISDAPHYIEVKAVQAVSSVSSDGSYQWWVDGVDQGTVTGVDNFNFMSDQNWRTYLQAENIPASTSGTIYFDSWKANDDGGLIGAFVIEPTFTGAGAQTATNTGGATLSPALPNGWAAGDLMVMLIAGRPNGSTITNTFSNIWTLQGSQFLEVGAGATDLWIGVYTRVAVTGDAAPTVTPDSDFLPGSTTGGVSAQIAGYRYITDMLDVAIASNTAAAAGTWTPPSVTTVSNNCMILSCVATDDDNALNFNTQNGFLLTMTGANYDTTTGSDHAVGMAFYNQSTLGAVTMPVWNESANSTDPWAGVTLAFRPPIQAKYLMEINQAVKRASFV